MVEESKRRKRPVKEKEKPSAAKSKIENDATPTSLTDISQEQLQPTYTQREIGSVRQSLSKLSKHFIILIFVIVLAVAMHFLLKNVFGDPKFFDLIPVRWVIDLGDIAIILTFVIIVIRELWKVDDNDEVNQPK